MNADEDVLEVGPLRIPLLPTPEGPQLAPRDPELEAMGWVINLAVQPGGEGIFDAIVNGSEWGGNEVGVEQVGPEHDVSAGRAAWRRLTGTDPHPPLTVLAMGFLPHASVVPRAIAAEAARALRDLRRTSAVEPPWMFRRDPPVWPVVHPSERALIDHFDRRARDIDERAAPTHGANEPPELLHDRSALLVDLDAAGLLSPVHEQAKRERLRLWGADALESWYAAAVEASRYLASQERRRYVKDATAEPVWGSPVTLDLFRAGLLTPPQVHPYEWASWGEFLLLVDPLPDDMQGEFLHHDIDGWVTERWRRDYGPRASLRYLALGSA